MSISLPADIVLFVLDRLDFGLKWSHNHSSKMEGYYGSPAFHLPTLHACSLVCRLWAALAQPLLFRHALLRTGDQTQAFVAAIAGSTDRGRRLKESVRRITIYVTSGHWTIGKSSLLPSITVQKPSEDGKRVSAAGTTDDLVQLLRHCPSRGLHHLTVVANDLLDFNDDLGYVALDQSALDKLENPPSITCLSVETNSDQPNIAPWQLLRMFTTSIRILALLGDGRIPDYKGPFLQLHLYEFIWMKTRSLGWNSIPPLLTSSRGHLKAINIRGPKVNVREIIDEHCQDLQSICVSDMGRWSGFPPQDWTRFPQLRQLVMHRIILCDNGRPFPLDLPGCVQHLGTVVGRSDAGEGDTLHEEELWIQFVRHFPNLRVVNIPPAMRNVGEGEMAKRAVETRTKYWVGCFLGIADAPIDRQLCSYWQPQDCVILDTYPRDRSART
jgi:hypothetical protein